LIKKYSQKNITSANEKRPIRWIANYLPNAVYVLRRDPFYSQVYPTPGTIMSCFLCQPDTLIPGKFG
ncbi:MAG: hypothetical protein JXK94_14420, partial [Deltaproteobacteria bacterium]|nr:hypothetical protein [Deltaproteobacteria bacterium]